MFEVTALLIATALLQPVVFAVPDAPFQESRTGVVAQQDLTQHAVIQQGVVQQGTSQHSAYQQSTNQQNASQQNANQHSAYQQGASQHSISQDSPRSVPPGLGVLYEGRTQLGASGFRADSTLISKLAGQALLQQLSLLDANELRDFVRTYPNSIEQLLLDPPAATRTTAWWHRLPVESQHKFSTAAPEIVGNLPGIPYRLRDASNILKLQLSMNALQAQVTTNGDRGARTDAGARLAMLKEVEKALDASPGASPRSLVSLDTKMPGRAVIAVGDLASANYISYLIPGMLFNVEGQIGDWTDTAAELRAEQQTWINLLSKADPVVAKANVATVAWLGYETPGLFNVGSDALANQGAAYLTGAMDALFTERAADRPFVSLVAHSYGSTAAMKALATGNFEVDSFAAVGSPGGTAQSVGELFVRDHNMFVGEASWDPVPGTGFFGSKPGAASFGAQRMSVAGSVDTITLQQLRPSLGHNEYFVPGSESMRNMALIGIDREELVSDGSGQDVMRAKAYFAGQDQGCCAA